MTSLLIHCGTTDIHCSNRTPLFSGMYMCSCLFTLTSANICLNQARATRDAMAKGLYQMLFEWMVNSVNMALAQRTRDNKLRSQVWLHEYDIIIDIFVYCQDFWLLKKACISAAVIRF